MEHIVSGVGQGGGGVREGASVTVTTTARLHLGFMDPSGRGPRGFGSLGLSLDRPQTRLTLRRAASLSAQGFEAARAARHLTTLADLAGIAPDYALNVDHAIPAHAGLGSGTQLALAVGAAFAALTDAPLTPEDTAVALQRGKRSGIGIGAFLNGGVLVDGGHGSGTKRPPILARLPFPEQWRILLILDAGENGVHGEEERTAFGTLPPFPAEETADLCRRLLLHALPALTEANLMDFSAEVRHLQHRMGDYFAPAQGGRYASPAVTEVLSLIEAHGVAGVGQSSWGPTGFALLGSEDAAIRLRDAIAQRSPPGVEFAVARGLNRGALIERHR